jgi:amino acid adenylation domain-containing protein
MVTATASCDAVCERISEIKQTFPQSVALRSGGHTLTYEELHRKADKFAAHLAHLGVAPGDTVSICMERSFDWIVAALGIMRLGAAYVPLDCEWPDSRLRFALEDSGATAVVSREPILKRLQCKVPGIDPVRDAAAIAAAPRFRPQPIDPESLAYVIYTSGSTGVPKGVEITHANLNHLIDWHLDVFAVQRQDRASHLAGLGFDAAVWEIWPYLSIGASLSLADDQVRSSPELIQQWMLREAITIGFVPTVHASAMMAITWPETTSLRLLLTGGDALHHHPPTDLPFRVVNNYGPTECTVVSTCSMLKAGSAGVPTIGRAIAGAHVYLLDEHGVRVQDGEPGEICIGGNGVGRGYRNLPDATQRSFVPDPFAGEPGARMYRSGDRGVRRPNGEIEFRGRLDRQAKIRGYRIELDEIAAVLSQYPGIGFSTATVDVAENGESHLVAYVMPEAHAPMPTAHDLQDHLLRSLPHYMVPAVFVRLSAVPLSPSGKLDLKMLPKPTATNLLARDSARLPASQIEEQLLDMAKSLLQNDTVTAEDNFFLAGGHSLLGMQLILRVRETFNIELSLRQLFEAPTVDKLAQFVEKKLAQDRITSIWMAVLGLKKIEPDARFNDLGGNDAAAAKLKRRLIAEFGRHIAIDELDQCQTVRQQAELMLSDVHDTPELPAGVVALQPNGLQDAIFWLHYPTTNVVKAMGNERPFYYVTLTEDDTKLLGKNPTMQAVAARFVHKIVAAQPEGPYIIGGYCLGGLLSYEVAYQMMMNGHDVSDLVMLDPPSPQFSGLRPAGSFELLRRPGYVLGRIFQLGLKGTLHKLRHRTRTELPEPEGVHIVAEPIQLLASTAASRYKPSRYSGKVLLLLPAESEPETNFLPFWQRVVPRNLLQQRFVSGHHGVMTEDSVHEVAGIIEAHLANSREERLLESSQSGRARQPHMLRSLAYGK